MLSILSLFLNELNKFNNKGSLMLYSIYHMKLNYIKMYSLHENVKIFF